MNKKHGIYFKIVIVVLILINSANIFSQDSVLQQHFNFGYQKILDVKQALEKISLKTGYNFTYDHELLTPGQKYHTKDTSLALEDILHDIIRNKEVCFKVIKNHIVISRIEPEKEKQADQEKYITISGVICDQNSNKKLGFANIGLSGDPVGAISNNSGEFIIHIPEKFSEDSIKISYIGYKSFSAAVDELAGNEQNIIKLEPDIIPIQEIFIRNQDPDVILTSAIKKIPENFSSSRVRMSAFYRESVTKDKEYAIYSEAILDISKSAYTKLFHSDQISIYKARKLYDASNLDSVLLKLKSGIHSSLQLDIIKNRLDFLSEYSQSLYDYELSNMINFQDELVYVLKFEPAKTNEEPVYRGKIYVNSVDLAIMGAEFSLLPSFMRKAGNMFVIKKSAGIKVKPVHAAYKVSYRKNGQFYYFSHARAELELKIRKKGHLFSKKFETFIELAQTSINTLNHVKIDKKKRIRSGDILSEKNFSYVPAFWGNQNYIKPEEDITEALMRVEKMMKEIKK